MPKCRNMVIWAQTTQKFKKKSKIMFFINTLLKSPQWLSDDHFSPRYGQKRVLGPKMTKYGYLGPDPRKMKIFKNNFFHQMGLTYTLSTSPQWLFNLVANSNYAYFCIFDPLMTKYGNSAPDLQIFEFLKNCHCFRIVSSIHFQRDLNGYQKLK